MKLQMQFAYLKIHILFHIIESAFTKYILMELIKSWTIVVLDYCGKNVEFKNTLYYSIQRPREYEIKYKQIIKKCLDSKNKAKLN